MKLQAVLAAIAGALAAAASFPPEGQAAAAPLCRQIPGGTVLDYVGDPRGYQLSRDDRPTIWRSLMELVPGDQLLVVAPAGSVRIHDGAGPDRYYGPRDGVLCISQAAAPSWLDNAIRIVADRLARRSATQGVPLSTRGEPLTIALPDLRGGTAVVHSGNRSVALAWHGGAPPYAVRITGPLGAVVDEEGIHALRLMLAAPRRLAPGDYDVTVTDAAGVQRRGRFIALDSGPDQASDLQRLIQQVADQDPGGTRTFDLYLDAAALRSSSALAFDLMKALED